jgi:hypothetical protein
MKKLLTALFLLSASINFAQINLEHQYPSYVGITEVAANDWNYYTQVGNTLTIYDITHTLIKTITIPTIAGYTASGPSAVSTTLFNTDSYYEYGEGYTGPTELFVVYNELGTQLLRVDSAYNGSCYNTSAGLKMIVDTYYAKAPKGNVYSLGGNFLASAPEVTNGNNNYTLSNPYPNPSNNMIHLTYELPAGTDKAEMYITNISGQVVKTCNVGSAFNDILLDTKQYSPGEYFYYIHTDNYTSPTSKFIINR